MKIHPLVTVKQAATALGVDKEVIRNMIDIGAVRAERRFVKNRERWFLYQEEVQDHLAKRAQELSAQASRTTMEGLGEFFTEPDSVIDGNEDEPEHVVVTEVAEHEEDHPDRLYLQTQQSSIDQMLHSLTIEFAHRLCEERQIICNLQQQLDERNGLLAKIPDLTETLDQVKSIQAAREAEIAELKKHVADLESDLAWWKKPWWNRWFGSPAKR